MPRKGKNVYTCATDTQKAFDSLKRDKIRQVLVKRQVTKELTEVIKSVYCSTWIVTRLLKHKTDESFTRKNVKLGGTLIPLIFIIMIH